MSEQLADLPVSYEELRSLLIDWLSHVSGGQLNDLRTAIANLALDRGHAGDPAAQRQAGYGVRTVSFGGYGQVVLSDKDYGRAQSIIWDLIIEGVLRPGLGDGLNDSLPFFHLTDFCKHR